MIETPEFRFQESDHTYWLGSVQLPSVTQIISSCGLISEWSKDPAAAERGTDIHLAAKYLFQGVLDWSTVSMEIMGYIVSLDKWIEQTGVQVESCEVAGYNKQYLYAGSWDVIGRIPEYGRILCDLKSGPPTAWHPLQTSAYTGIAGRGLKRGGLYLQKDGSMAKFQPHKDTADWGKFLAALTVYRMKEDM